MKESRMNEGQVPGWACLGLVIMWPIVLLLSFAGWLIFSDPGKALLFGVASTYGLSYLVFKSEQRKSVSAPIIRTSGRNIPQWVKIAVAHRDEGTCRQCGSAYDLQYDHIVPYSRGGNSADVDNIQLLCGRCNRRKGNRYVG
jgi:hypothetical protein